MKDFFYGQRKTTPLTSFEYRLLIIGNGKWGDKVRNALTVNKPSTLITQISVRSFLASPQYFLQNKYTHIWLCARPNLQSAIVTTLAESDSLVILEKPIALSKQDFSSIRASSLFQNGKLRLSRVWNYSEIWQQFLKEKFLENIDIDIARGGPGHSSLIPMSLDWLPHDLYLLADLFRSDFLAGSMTSTRIEENRLNVEYTVLGSNLRLTVGEFKESRVAKWKVKYDDESFVIVDFISSTLVYSSGEKVDVVAKHDSITQNLVCSDQNSFEDVIRDFDIQESFTSECFPELYFELR